MTLFASSAAAENPKGTAGFTLIEVIIGLCIFSIGIMAVYGMQLQSVQMNANARRLTEASSAARDVLERLKGLDYDSADLKDTNADGQAGLDSIGEGADHSAGNVFWNIAVNSPVPNTKTIHAISTWTWRGELKRVTYRTIIVKEG